MASGLTSNAFLATDLHKIYCDERLNRVNYTYVKRVLLHLQNSDEDICFITKFTFILNVYT
jgi:hypothetical protein